MKLPGPFVNITNRIIKPHKISFIQTDGSYIPSSGLARTAVILRAPEEHRLMQICPFSSNSTEAEWQSVFDGIDFAISKKQYSLELENDNLSVINSLIFKKTPRSEIALLTYLAILDEIRNLDWVGVRWIPRELNKADRLFRLR